MFLPSLLLSWAIASLLLPLAQHISKYSRQDRRMITETAEIYKNAVLPWIESQPKSRLLWVHNILQGIKEKESVLFRDDDPDTGFIVLPDR